MIYLDNASSSKISEDVLTTYQTLLVNYFANPSGNHLLARDAERLQEKARNELLNLFNYRDGRVIFTSGGTEANNLAMIGLFLQYKKRGNEIIISAFEHPSITQSAAYLADKHGAKVHIIPLLNGHLDFEALKEVLNKNTVLVSIMGVNNEIGTLTDLKTISDMLKDYPKVIFHSDLTQAVGKVDVPYNTLDAFTYSAHKIHGLKGSGALILRKKLTVSSLLHGGSQEDGMRPGTSNTPANIVLAKTTRLALENQKSAFKHVLTLANKLTNFLQSHRQYFVLHSTLENPFIVNFSLKTFKASVILNALENDGIYVGTTSSCSAKLNEPSTSVLALTHDHDYALNSIRVSFSSDNSQADVDALTLALLKHIRGQNHG